MIQRLGLSLLMVIALLAGVSSGNAQVGVDPNQPDTLKVDSSVAFIYGSGVVPVNFFNDEKLSAMEVVLHHNCPHVLIDSFSFAGGRLEEEGFANGFTIDTTDRVITIFSTIGSSLIPSGDGLLGKLYLSYPQTITEQVIPIDTITWMSGLIEHRTSFVGEDFLSDPFTPQFAKGYLDIQETPVTFDSVWVSDVATMANEPTAVGIYTYNERDLNKIAVALEYGTGLLHFDSISYLDGRGAAASKKTIRSDTTNHTLRLVLTFGDFVPLVPGSGLLATIHFTVGSGNADTIVVIDSTTVGTDGNTRFTLTSVDGSVSYVPRFHPGSVAVTMSTDVKDITDEDNLPTDYSLAQNYPNPFNPTTDIEFTLPVAARVKLDVFNILGRKVRRLIDQDLPAGVHRVTFNGQGDNGKTLATGVYFYRLNTESYTETKKMLLLK